MTSGQERALRELARLQAMAPELLEIIGTPQLAGEFLHVSISRHIGVLDTRPGGLALREREEFQLFIPPDFPFEVPRLRVDHTRFAGFDHVTWGKALCLYQSKVEWNPADGLFGYFDRLSSWLEHAARNDMDPPGGPLEPPHFVTDYSQLPVIVRADAPAAPGTRWLGWATLSLFSKRVEIVGWRSISENWPAERQAAFAVFLPQALPMEFPEKGADFFAELAKQQVDRNMVLFLLGVAALATADGDPVRLVLGAPMRRGANGMPRQHIAVWSADPEFARYLRATLPPGEESERLRALRTDFADAVFSHFEQTTLTWCPVFEDRNEIVVRRDAHTPMSWFCNKSVLLLGCGALGSWAGEHIARARPRLLHLVDNSQVRPGLLTRQNFALDDIGSNKATALAKRVNSCCAGTDVQAFEQEAHAFLTSDLQRLRSYDIVFDCTASSILQMKIERDWVAIGGCVQRLFSFMIDARAHLSIGIALGDGGVDGPWSAYLRWKYKLCTEDDRREFTTAFYDSAASAALFQPEPGCSDPTFSGSAADVSVLAGAALNVLLSNPPVANAARGFAFSAPHVSSAQRLATFNLPLADAAIVGGYRVLICPKVLNQARAFARQNSRLRSPQHETGGLLWGFWDDAASLIILFDASGPPPDSQHDEGHFVCGTRGTVEEHTFRSQQSRGVCGFLGFWHTHPDLPAHQSGEDMRGMTQLIAGIGHNQRRALMLIFGRQHGAAQAGLYVYESRATNSDLELIDIGVEHLTLMHAVV